MYPPVNKPPILDGPILNPEPAQRTEGAQKLAAELLDVARELPDPAAAERMKKLTGALHSVDPLEVSGDDNRLAFWINVYNALNLQAHAVEQTAGKNLLRNLGIFDRAAWRVGSWRYSLNFIEHGLLRRNARQPAPPWFRIAWSSDQRLAAAPSKLDPRIHFTLNCGAVSCPPIRHYLSGEIEAQLALATEAYFQTEASVDAASRTVKLPKLMKYYARDFGDPIAFAKKYLPGVEDGMRVTFGEYDWTVVGAGDGGPK